MNRRNFLRTTGLAAAAAVSAVNTTVLHAEPVKMAFEPVEQIDGTDWYDAATLPMEGRAWEGEERLRPFDRFPKRWMEQIPVRGLAQHSAGMAVRFVTNSSIKITYDLLDGNLAMYHMPATGKSGFDVYGRDDAGKMKFIQMIQRGKTVTAPLSIGLPAGPADQDGCREFMIYFPTYNGVNSFRIGVPQGKIFKAAPARAIKPIFFYGTSITHGGCSSRTSLCCPALLGRRLNAAHWNFGFSGSGRMEPVMAQAFAELDPSIFVLDCNWNMSPDMIRERLEPFVKTLRAARPQTPILISEDYPSSYPYAWAGYEDKLTERQIASRDVYKKLQDENIPGLTYFEGRQQMPEDGEGTVDNCHANDYGFFCQANAFEPVIRKLVL